jgi:NAD(P)-dependent dehydrogenase (short-subunit alcohol dehydrogenase family)
MQELAGKVAVVTGAASGIGLALTEAFALTGMKVVMADVAAGALAKAADEMTDKGHTVLPVPTDVSDAGSVSDLADAALRNFNKVHIVCNNAGIMAARPGPGKPPVWEVSPQDWHWLISVNLWGVINGCRTFLPILLSQNEPAHVVNTASMAGLVPGASAYGVTKHAVVAYTESVYGDLKKQSAPVGVSVLCPFSTSGTRIHSSERVRLPKFSDGGAQLTRIDDSSPPEHLAGMPVPSDVARQVLAGICDERLYIVTSAAMNEVIQGRMTRILNGGLCQR